MISRCAHVGSLARIARAAVSSQNRVGLARRDVRKALTPRKGARATFASSSAAGDGDSYSVLIYDYVPDILDKRGPFRAAHIEAAKKMAAEDRMAMAGAFADPVDGALFIFKNVSKEDIEAYVQNDAYVQNGLVTGYKIKPWTVVVP
ncbi:YCII domain-containing protein [Chloropicon primus]|uniref:YCII-related domain-containing protein n=1 Tax=Chloropicon primus TaxID=1764295 RepID=A0A5B8MD13_9CHLO|nr:hypothetical protein A3770_01p05220 [Chloropicon primus]UPQ97219.1 YCII domain-containing protein [Chloropicon primus]|mmetsp:Transcript_14145/g.40079  ORF Transcript_14145/g.40079 Transcript_14145/m.40079 type:complete len:147 (+) Transcript_14145:110-550(+)|eukprot:QDZ18004.1 hypothetical protein A3770_01p05220 [Chloropicon primus]